MHLPPPDMLAVRSAIRGLSTEAAEKRAVQRLFEERALGHVWPETVHGKVDNATVRVHLWRVPGFDAGGIVALVTGPSVKGDARLLYPHAAGQPVGQVYIPATGRRPALTDVKSPGAAFSTSEIERSRRSASSALYRSRLNPEGGRESAGTTSSLAQIQKAVHDARSEQAQVNLVARVLAGQGYAAAGKPEVHATTVDRSTFRIYLWRDTPFGDHLVLSTGPSFEPRVALASQIPAEPGVGFYIKALVDRGTPGAKRVLAGAGRAAARAMPKPTPAAEAAAEKVARKARVPKAAVVAAAAQVAEAEGSPTVQVKHVEEVATDPEYAAERAQADLPPLAAAERLRHPAERTHVDEGAAMREAAELIAALRKMRRAS